MTLLSNYCKTSGNTAKDKQKYLTIFLLVCSGSRVTKFQLYIHYMFTICSVYIHCIFTGGSYIRYLAVIYIYIVHLYIHYIFTICTLYVPYIFTVYSLYFHYMFPICSLYVHYMFTTCSLHVHYYVNSMFTIYSLYNHYIIINDEYVTLLSNYCKASGNTAKDEQKCQPIFLLVFP